MSECLIQWLLYTTGVEAATKLSTWAYLQEQCLASCNTYHQLAKALTCTLILSRHELRRHGVTLKFSQLMTVTLICLWDSYKSTKPDSGHAVLGWFLEYHVKCREAGIGFCPTVDSLDVLSSAKSYQRKYSVKRPNSLWHWWPSQIDNVELLFMDYRWILVVLWVWWVLQLSCCYSESCQFIRSQLFVQVTNNRASTSLMSFSMLWKWIWLPFTYWERSWRVKIRPHQCIYYAERSKPSSFMWARWWFISNSFKLVQLIWF